jgi:xanthine dehydrogenase YagR molybdenum-binding subunit
MRGHRIEGAEKVRGRAMFVDDLRDESLGFTPLTAVAVTAPTGPGRITNISSDQAPAVPGVTAVITHQNAPRLRKVISLSMSGAGFANSRTVITEIPGHAFR